MVEIIINPPNARMLADPCGAFLWIDEDAEKVFEALHQRYAKRAIEVYGGRTRNVFQMPGGYVVKLPKNYDGLTDNDWEGSVSNTPESLGDPCCVQYPRTRLVYSDEIPILFMETITPMTSKEIIAFFGTEPDWVMSVDGGQVGINKNGRLVAYDYGLK